MGYLLVLVHSDPSLAHTSVVERLPTRRISGPQTCPHSGPERFREATRIEGTGHRAFDNTTRSFALRVSLWQIGVLLVAGSIGSGCIRHYSDFGANEDDHGQGEGCCEAAFDGLLLDLDESLGLDGPSPEVADIGPNEQLGRPCESDEECLSGYCVQGPGTRVCSIGCSGDCPEAWICRQMPGTAQQPVHVCVPVECLPCGFDCATCCPNATCDPWESPCTCPTDCGLPCAGRQCGDNGCGASCGECDDTDPCTTDSCDEAGTCEYQYNSDSCDDEKPCTVSDTCREGACEGIPKTCADSNPCTENEWCNPDTGVCEYTALDSVACEDGNLCTGSDKCVSGICVPGLLKSCNDNNQCTINDTCNPSTGQCETTPMTGLPCDDGDGCTVGDMCGNGLCLAGSDYCAASPCNPTPPQIACINKCVDLMGPTCMCQCF